MTFLLTLWRFRTLGLAGLLALSVVGARFYGAHEYNRGVTDGKAYVYNGARFDSTLWTLTGAIRKQARARTDTIVRTVTKRIATVETVTVHVPDSVRVLFPVVDTALRACTALAQDCGRLRTQIAEERQAHDLQRAVDSAAIRGLSIGNVKLREDSLHLAIRLQHKPGWKMVGAVGILASVLGAVAEHNRR